VKEVRMKDTRKTVKVNDEVKMNLKRLQKEIAPGKNESFLLAYLIEMYNDQRSKKITVADHQTYMALAEVMNYKKK